MKSVPAMKPRRVGFLDEVRGFIILLMVAYHAAYDIIYIFGLDIPIFHSKLLEFLQPFVAGMFIVISGIACRYSRSNLKRGAKALLLGLLLTAITLLIMPEQAIYFGILHFMGTAMILFALMKPALDRLPPIVGVILSAALFAATYHLPDGYLGFGWLYRVTLPDSLYMMRYLMPLGFAGAGSDYFPLIPWLFLYFAGAYAGVFFANNMLPDWFYRTRSKALAYVGRHAIVIYLLHQPVTMAVLWIVFRVASRIRGLM